MLEHTLLIVQDWTHGPTGWVRRVADSHGNGLGMVQFDGPLPGAWLAWLHRLKLEIFETDDMSHLMTLVTAWGMRRSWHVDDAEGYRIGTLHRGQLVSSDGVTLGHHEGTSSAGRILDSADLDLASYRRTMDRTIELTFTPQAMENPFLRMMLLGMVLVRNAVPA